MATTQKGADDGASAGVACAILAFLIWGLSPAYWKLLKSVDAFEILMHRMVWSFLFLLPFLALRGRWSEFIATLKTPRRMIGLLASTVFVTVNWFTFIYAINHDQILQTSLGYYISPLVNVLLGTLVLKERLRPIQGAAVVIAAVAVLYLTFGYGRIPWMALILAFSFGFYGLIRKMVAVGALVGLTIETLLLSAPAMAYLVFLDATGQGAFLRAGAAISILLMGAATVTGLPLLLFTIGARRIHLSTVGFLQYIAPTCSFFLAVFAFGEPFSGAKALAFALIWIALAIYSVDSFRYYRRTHPRA